MAKFAHNPSEEHLLKARYIMRYLAGTRKYALVYNGKSDGGLYAYCDSSYGDDRSDADQRRDTSFPLRTLVSSGILRPRH